MSYVDGVSGLLEEIDTKIRKNKFCNKPEDVKSKLNDLSHRVLDYLDKFEWTLTYDGRDYEGLTKKFGCGNQDSISKHVKKENACEKNRSHGYNVNKNRSLKIGH